MEPYRPGETLTVIERNVRVLSAQQDPEYGLGVIVEQVMRGGARRPRLVYADAPGTTVQRVAPPEGEPRPGQVWADRLGGEWFAVSEGPRTGLKGVRLVSPDGHREPWLHLHAHPEVGPLRLVRDVPPPADVPEEES